MKWQLSVGGHRWHLIGRFEWGRQADSSTNDLSMTKVSHSGIPALDLIKSEECEDGNSDVLFIFLLTRRLVPALHLIPPLREVCAYDKSGQSVSASLAPWQQEQRKHTVWQWRSAAAPPFVTAARTCSSEPLRQRKLRPEGQTDRMDGPTEEWNVCTTLRLQMSSQTDTAA